MFALSQRKAMALVEEKDAGKCGRQSTLGQSRDRILGRSLRATGRGWLREDDKWISKGQLGPSFVSLDKMT